MKSTLQQPVILTGCCFCISIGETKEEGKDVVVQDMTSSGAIGDDCCAFFTVATG
jgi:hypothetical protein